MSVKSLFQNRKLLIAGKHGKESVIAPVFEKELGVQCISDTLFDTDDLGTFTGETERKLDPIANAREKCLQAMRLNDIDLGIASEGSFGPHPTLFFVPADDEFLIFIDQRHEIEIIVRELSTSTNFNGMQVQSYADLLTFARQCHFPEHALILRKSREDNIDLFKGIQDDETLKNVFDTLRSKYPFVYAETDMRACYNPTRLKVIEKAAIKLAEKIKSTCPHCGLPGFGITEAKKGLPCSLCGAPTAATLSYLYRCQRCEYEKEELYPNQKTQEDPTYCNYCNP